MPATVPTAEHAGHLKAFTQRQNSALDELDKWDRGGCDDWPGGDSGIVSYIRNLGTVHVPTAADIAAPRNLGEVASQYLSSGGGFGWGPIRWIAGGLAALGAGVAAAIRAAGSFCESGICYA